MAPRFIKVFKDNKTKDRGFIAVDAICSVFENQENHNVSIMTMDGFWYDVEDDVEELYKLVMGDDKKDSNEEQKSPKREYFRRKKMMPAMSENDRLKRNHEELRQVRNNPGGDSQSDDDLDVFRPVMRKPRGRNPGVSRIENNLPASVGEGHYNLNPKTEPPPLGKGL